MQIAIGFSDTTRSPLSDISTDLTLFVPPSGLNVTSVSKKRRSATRLSIIFLSAIRKTPWVYLLEDKPMAKLAQQKESIKMFAQIKYPSRANPGGVLNTCNTDVN
jgi:hypothetical protein